MNQWKASIAQRCVQNAIFSSRRGWYCNTVDLEEHVAVCDCLLLSYETITHFSRGSSAACLLRSWVRIPPWAWMSVCCECCVLSGRGLLQRADHPYRGVLPTVVSRWMWSKCLVNEVMAHWGDCCAKQKKIHFSSRFHCLSCDPSGWAFVLFCCCN